MQRLKTLLGHAAHEERVLSVDSAKRGRMTVTRKEMPTIMVKFYKAISEERVVNERVIEYAVDKSGNEYISAIRLVPHTVPSQVREDSLFFSCDINNVPKMYINKLVKFSSRSFYNGNTLLIKVVL